MTDFTNLLNASVEAYEKAIIEAWNKPNPFAEIMAKKEQERREKYIPMYGNMRNYYDLMNYLDGEND